MCIHTRSHSPLVGGCFEFLRPGEGKRWCWFPYVMLLCACQRNITLGKCCLWKRSNTIVYLCAPVNYSTPLILPSLTSQIFGITQCCKYIAVYLIQLHWWTITYLWQTRLKHYMADMPREHLLKAVNMYLFRNGIWHKNTPRMKTPKI